MSSAPASSSPLQFNVPSNVYNPNRFSQPLENTAPSIHVDVPVIASSNAVRGMNNLESRKEDNFELYVQICKICFAYAIFVILGVIALVYGIRDENDECQEGTRGGLNLSDMTKGMGVEFLIFAHLFIFAIIIGGYTKSAAPLVIVCILDVVFKFIWYIWTIVVLATNENNNCVASGSDMAIICIVYICIGSSTSVTLMG